MAKMAKEEDSVIVDEKGDEVPAEPETTEAPAQDTSAGGPSHWRRFKAWYKANKKLSIPLSVVVLVLLLLAIPFTRYPLAGSVYKKNYTVAVFDAVTHTPVSGATISLGDIKADTGGDGRATLHVSVGPHTFSITKNNYSTSNLKATVPLFGQNLPTINLSATGRQVKITVTNSFNHKPLANVNIKLPDGQAQTDATGSALTVVPEDTKSAKATLSLEGYNDNEVTIQADDNTIKQNDVTITPAGKLYFLSKLSGKIDVVKTDLDGKHRKKVLPGTGNEQDSNTILLASRDWKYLVLLSRRASLTAKPTLYLVDTSSDSVTTLDEGAASFTPIGWDEHYFLYEVERSNVKPYQSGTASIKSFNADNRQITQLDNAIGVGSNNNHYAHEQYDYFYAGRNNFYLINHNLVYSKSWDWNYDDETADFLVKNKKNSIQQINVNGSGHRVLLSFDVNQYLQSFLNDPQTIDYHAEGNKYYEYKNGAVTENSELKDTWAKYYDTYVTNTYLLSPSGKQVFWSEQLDGKNTLRVGDASAQNPKLAGRSADLIPYGWYTDDYLLLSKSQSELYIMPSSASDSVKAFHITDYHKPARSFYGYGGGYGGL